jgi:hypothetical protein
MIEHPLIVRIAQGTSLQRRPLDRRSPSEGIARRAFSLFHESAHPHIVTAMLAFWYAAMTG